MTILSRTSAVLFAVFLFFLAFTVVDREIIKPLWNGTLNETNPIQIFGWFFGAVLLCALGVRTLQHFDVLLNGERTRGGSSSTAPGEFSSHGEADDAEVDEENPQVYKVNGVGIGVEMIKELADQELSDSQLIALANDYHNHVEAGAAMYLLADPDRPTSVLEDLKITQETPVEWDRLVTRVLMRRDPRYGLARCLMEFPWAADQEIKNIFEEHMDQILAKHGREQELETIVDWIGQWQGDPDQGLSHLESFVDPYFMNEVKKLVSEKKEAEAFESVAKVWTWDDLQLNSSDTVDLSGFSSYREEILKGLESKEPRSLLIHGVNGVGKETLIRSILADLVRIGWRVVEASAQDLVAGMMYVGQMEERWKSIIGNLSASKTILFIPEFVDMDSAGRHQNNPISLLDRLIVELRRKKLITVGIAEEHELELLLRGNRSLRAVFDLIPIQSPGEDVTLRALQSWLDREVKSSAPDVEVSEEVLRKVVTLSQQYLTYQDAFGSSFDLLKEIVKSKKEASESVITAADVVKAISKRSGMPTVIVDDEEHLDPEDVRAFFQERLIGQEEALNCMVDRITLLKAGLTDPGRPLGVFFFAGPTGTGKTESAKILAEYLFGSKDRLERIDMSELQSAQDLSRLVGVPEGFQGVGSQHSLLDAVRRQPFCVVLLDEFEKAHPNVWDMFLQAFDDARMSDQKGLTVSLRHVVFILTSNVGAMEAAQGAFGFNPESGGENLYEKALRETFRPEFLNRLDQVVTFRPFTRGERRALLEMELKRVLSRRGLRDRPWAVEWEESAIDFLLSHGLTSQLGARPLRRAVERHALTPIAQEMMLHDLPEEDQFLFVRSDGHKIEVDFVDPDAVMQEEEEAELPPVDLSGEDLRVGNEAVARVALRGSGRLEEVLILADRVEQLEGLLDSDQWQSDREIDLKQMSEPGFWDSVDRLPLLASAELRDRIDSGTHTARSLLDRLGGDAVNSRDRYPAEVIRRLAMQIHLLENALQVLEEKRPQDAYIRITPLRRDRESAEAGLEWSGRITEMIRTWAKKRNMKLEEFDISSAQQGSEGGWLAAVNGFAAYSLLEPLSGVHELERPEANRNDRRIHVRIDVAPRPLGVEPLGKSQVAIQAKEVLSTSSTVDEVVRRYRVGENPKLVDLRQGWRCASPGDALAGDFDLVGSLASLAR